MAVPADERDFRGPGCDERCHVERVLRPGMFGRSELLLHDPDAHQAYGIRLGSLGRCSDAHVVRTGPLGIDLDAWTVTLDDRTVHLTPTELRVLMMLARRPGQLVRHADLVAAVWGSSFLAVGPSWWRHTVRVNISRLRRRLGSAGSLVASVPDEGFRLVIVAAETPLPSLGRWARRWDACRDCGRTDRHHRARGFCETCCERVRNRGTR